MNKKIMIIDDDQELRKLLSLCLSIEGIQSLEASQGAEALAILESLPLHERPVLFIVDNSMPVMDGPTFITELYKQELVRSPEIILYTGSISMPEVSIAGKQIQVFAKPLDMDVLMGIIRKSLNESERKRPSFNADLSIG